MYELKEMTGSTLEKVFPLMKELRTNLDLETFLRIHEEARKADGYKIVGLVKGDFCVALMGYRTLHDYVHGKHIYIDDLIVTKDVRSQGLGKMLLDHAVRVAAEQGCQGLRLCTGIENQDGRRFYEREGWAGRALAYKKKL